MIEIFCCVCGQKVFRRQGEVTRSKKLGRRLYCSLQCVGKDNNKHLPCGNSGVLRPNNKRDEFSPYRWHYRNAQRRTRKVFSLTLQDLKKQWELQKGVCPYTGWLMDNPPTIKKAHESKNHPRRASLDRKDSTKGYTPENIQFVCLMVNYAKNRYSDQELQDFCDAVANHRHNNAAN